MSGILNENKIEAMVCYLNETIEKKKSPAVLALFNGEKFVVNIDEGSELNCVDANFMHKNKLQIVPTNTGAKSAGSFSMKIEGQTNNSVLLDVLTQDGTTA